MIDPTAGRIAKTSEELQFAGQHLLLSPDGKLAMIRPDTDARRSKDGGLLGGYVYENIRVIDLSNMKIVSELKNPDRSDSDAGLDFAAFWLPDSKTVLSVEGDVGEMKVRLWDARSGRMLRTYGGHAKAILDLAVTSTGDKFLTASEDQTIRVWDVRSGKAEAVLAGHKAGLNKVVVLPGDKTAVSAAEESTAKVWDLTTGKLKFDLPDHDSAVREVVAASDTVVRTITLRGTARASAQSTS
jgi:WD40 repeat protein